ncbi:hypothetical protein GJ496_011050 [Pomphorhynchus laevis]|nr:hypothetical protein GJ496_011050 [Pomphorhynchus laevis]
MPDNECPISINEFIQKWSVVLPLNTLSRSKSKKSTSRLIDDNSELAKICDPNPLFGEDKLSTVLSLDDLLAPQLFTIDYLKQEFMHKTSRAFSDDYLLFNIDQWVSEELVSNGKDLLNCTFSNDAILTIHVFVPVPQRKRVAPAMHQELMMLSNQTLTELRESIVCACDHQRIGEFSDDPDSIKFAPIAREHYISSFFFIEDVFYNDCANSDADLSEHLIKWINGFNHRSQSATMSDTKLSSLTIMIGRPYLFCHIGGACEHVIVFSDIRMKAADDVWRMEKYPIHSYRQRVRFENCFICKRLYACWLVEGSSLVIDDPCLMCDICFKSSHYDENGKRLDDKFTAHHYSQRS